MNPPTLGHAGLVDFMLKEANRIGATPFIVVTQTQNAKKNPLSVNQKLAYLNAMFPNIRKIASSSPLPVIEQFTKDGYDEVTMVIGEDRGKQFNWVKSPKSVASRPANAVSATMARNAATRGNLGAFSKLVSNRVNAQRLMNNVRRGLLHNGGPAVRASAGAKRTRGNTPVRASAETKRPSGNTPVRSSRSRA